ncbi:MAG: hypothetical protein M0R46_12730 [Candidatus Muirbacterium halophilum]|nr:hypothetical protein [Candidatus Muirbacterium halophilum]
MKTLIIHPKDESTDFLSVIYEGMTNSEVLRSNPQCFGIKKDIKKADRIIMLGHGTESGLLGFNRYIINSEHVQLLKNKKCIFIWCNAKDFTTKYNLDGFATGMIISEIEEAHHFYINTNCDEIKLSNEMFANALRKAINNVDIETIILENYKGSNQLYEFNIKNIKQ